MPQVPRLSIELKNEEEIRLKDQAKIKAMTTHTTLHDVLIKALSEFCSKKN